MLEISVNLATHNRAQYLDACVSSLCDQTIDPSRYEICVVNNACTDETNEVVVQLASRYPQHKLFIVEEPQAGLSRARNKGITSTCAPLIADIDDDATAKRDWLECFLLRFAELPDDVGVIGGEINPVWMAPPPDWLDSNMRGILSAATNLGPNARYLDPHENVTECNTCYRREALLAAGNFPEELGRINGQLLSGEGAVNALIRSRGWSVFFEPAAVVNHTIHADRLSPAWLRRRVFWQGVSEFAMYKYYERVGLPIVNLMSLDLPLERIDWAFLNGDIIETTDHMKKFLSLGFALAMSGDDSDDMSERTSFLVTEKGRYLQLGYHSLNIEPLMTPMTLLTTIVSA